MAAIVTTLGWVPQVLKVARDRKADDISLVATGAIAIGVPGWPDWAFWIASIASVRIVLMQS